MRWVFKEASPGDMVRVRFGELYHYGVFVSEDEVIQFGLAPNLRRGIKDSEVKVLATDVEGFLAGAFLEVAVFDRKEEKRRIVREKTISVARSRIGDGGYNILHNNCEHFAFECVMGEHRSEQFEKAKDRLRAISVLDIYISKVPEKVKLNCRVPRIRRRDIATVSNERVFREKAYASMLLDHAMRKSLGIKLRRAEIQKLSSGKWVSPFCEFSISHSGGFCAVAISQKPVGVDIEPIREPSAEGFAKRVLTPKELSGYESLSGDERMEYLMLKWCEKESIFKASGKEAFVPSAIETGKNTRSKIILLDGRKFALGIYAESFLKMNIYENVEI